MSKKNNFSVRFNISMVTVTKYWSCIDEWFLCVHCKSVCLRVTYTSVLKHTAKDTSSFLHVNVTRILTSSVLRSFS